MLLLKEDKQEIAHYNPSALINIFNNALSGEAGRKLFSVKGIYQEGKGISYSGYYYDTLKDEATDASITLIVPALLRSSLSPTQTIECLAYLTKRVQLTGARIELQVNVVEVLAQTASTYTDEQIKAFEVLQKKAEQGYRDIDSFIKTKILKGELLEVTILIGRAGIIDADIKHQLKEAISFYNFNFVRINLASEHEILTAMETWQETDILVISRGGGENLDIFNRATIAEASLHLQPYFVTAIGHKENSPLLQKVADKGFITPTALGQYFNDIYNNTTAELQNSKAKLVEDITSQLKANYDKQLQNLSEKLKSSEELYTKSKEETALLYKREIELQNKQLATLTSQHQAQLDELRKISAQKQQLADNQLNELKTKLDSVKPSQNISWALVIIAIVLGIIIGKGCH